MILKCKPTSDSGKVVSGDGTEGKYSRARGVVQEKNQEEKKIQFVKEKKENYNILYYDYKTEQNILHKINVHLPQFNPSSDS